MRHRPDHQCLGGAGGRQHQPQGGGGSEGPRQGGEKGRGLREVWRIEVREVRGADGGWRYESLVTNKK